MKSRLLFLFALIGLLLVVAGCAGAGVEEGEAATELPYRYDNLPDPDEVSDSFEEFRAVSRWPKLRITYFFVNGTEQMAADLERDIVRAAFDIWSEQSALTFVETADRSTADIEVAWATREHGDGDPFDGPGGILAHATFPNPYLNRPVYLHFDDGEHWVDSPVENVDLLTVAIHEIGHAIGLAHSRDPNAIMFSTYAGPRRRLAADDLAGVQELYGIDAVVPPPTVPEPEESVPPSENADADRDGLSDAEEVLVTNTDPNTADTDGDGLGDGVEILNRMNPNNPDMDQDGVSDGDEVAAGTDPFFPDQATAASPELTREVSTFLSRAIQLQIRAFRQGDPTILESVLGRDVLEPIERQIEGLNLQGRVQVSTFDYTNSYIDDVRVISSARIEVDTCEYWSNMTYQVVDEEGERIERPQAIQSSGKMLVPQTLSLSRLNVGWRVTDVEFFSPPAFCSGG